MKKRLIAYHLPQFHEIKVFIVGHNAEFSRYLVSLFILMKGKNNE